MDFNYRIINNGEAFVKLQADWMALLQNSDCRTFFLSWQWQWQWWRHFGGELFIIVLTSANDRQLIAIFPFIRTHKPGFDVLQLIGAPDSDYLDIIIKKGCERQALTFFFNEFLAQNHGIGAVELDSINQRSPNWTYFQQLDSARYQITSTQKPCPYIELPDTWQQYTASLSNNMRYFIGRKTRKLEKTFRVRYGIADANDLPLRLQQFIDQHQSVWLQRQRPGAFKRSDFQQFHCAIAQTLLQQQQLKLLYLELDGQPAASYYLFREDNRYLYYLSGFDPQFSRYSPAVVLLAKAIREAIDEGFEEFDLMRGSGAYKYKWTTTQRFNHSWIIKKNRIWIRCYYRLQSIAQSSAMQLKQLLPSRLKNVLRDNLPAALIKKIDPLFR